MKTLILYATKHGAVGEIAKRIAKQMPNATVCDLKQGSLPPVDGFDCIIIGSSIYAGMIRKEAKSFLLQNTDVLLRKNLGLFLSGMDSSKEKTYFETNFSPEILQTARAKSFLGGIFDPKKAPFIDRLIMKVVAKQTKYTENITDDKIKLFVEELKA